MVRVVQSHQGVDLLVQVAITRREAIAEDMQNPEVDLIRAVRICRMLFRLDSGGVVI